MGYARNPGVQLSSRSVYRSLNTHPHHSCLQAQVVLASQHLLTSQSSSTGMIRVPWILGYHYLTINQLYAKGHCRQISYLFILSHSSI
jgi:hypothetical protein